MQTLTFNDQGEVSIPEGSWAEGDPASVIGVVDPLFSSREHVQHPLHGIVWVGPVHVPVNHPLPVLHPVFGPYHAAAHALQHHLRTGEGAHIVPCHHHTGAAAV